MDEPTGREPIEVYKAAMKQPDELIDYLLSDQPINNWMRDALALYFMGELKPPSSRGKPPVKPAARNVRIHAQIMYRLRKQEIIEREGSFYGKSAALIQEISKDCEISPDILAQDLRRGKLDASRLGWSVWDRFYDWWMNTHK
jgi:hypothetical protein